MSDFLDALAAPTLTARDGTVHTGTRWPTLREGLGFIRAAQERRPITEQLEGARTLLLGMGFPEAVVDDLDMAEAVRAAMDCFSGAFRRGTPPEETSTTG